MKVIKWRSNDEVGSVYIITYGMGQGGVSSHVETLASALKSVKRNVALVHPTRPSLLKMIVLALSSMGNINRARRIMIIEKQRQVKSWFAKLDICPSDVFHTHDVWTAYALFSVKPDVKIVHTIHGPASREILMDFNDDALSEYASQMEKQVYERAYRLIAVDEGQANIAIEDFGAKKHKIRIIRNTVDIEELYKVAVAGRQRTQELVGTLIKRSKNVVLARRLVEKNGVQVAIEALARTEADVGFWIVGDGPLRHALEKRVEELGVKDRVTFLGGLPRSEVISLMQEADVVLVPSVPAHGVVEATSIAALEGMAMGKIVIASRIGGLAEMIDHNVNGMLYEPFDIDDLASLLDTVDAEKHAELGISARSYVKEEWSTQAWVSQITEVYNE
ncbi:hypothetical protein DAETH_00970 [Deinococcus aetherius]|uniref:Glycosyltransferase n=1 Tax=Deinococcus aetherius TaxID=200252 RepID=A0ABN6RBV1_9DEIO|nr:glycosyltransferase family 4 protein [Deinococcus aetherius]BDP40128.1 hypothetical protein DAETH_00970 [Deinococcus aetherius]